MDKLIHDEEVLHELRPEPKLLVIWFFTRCLPFAFAGAGISLMLLGVLFNSIDSTHLVPTIINRTTLIIASFVIVFGPVVIAFLYSVYLRRTFVYYITDKRCIFHGGILRRVTRSVPYHKITDVEMSQNIVERMLGISSLYIFTPGTASIRRSNVFFSFERGRGAELSFVGLIDNETPAKTINEILRKYRATGE